MADKASFEGIADNGGSAQEFVDALIDELESGELDLQDLYVETEDRAYQTDSGKEVDIFDRGEDSITIRVEDETGMREELTITQIDDQLVYQSDRDPAEELSADEAKATLVDMLGGEDAMVTEVSAEPDMVDLQERITPFLAEGPDDVISLGSADQLSVVFSPLLEIAEESEDHKIEVAEHDGNAVLLVDDSYTLEVSTHPEYDETGNYEGEMVQVEGAVSTESGTFIYTVDAPEYQYQEEIGVNGGTESLDEFKGALNDMMSGVEEFIDIKEKIEQIAPENVWDELPDFSVVTTDDTPALEPLVEKLEAEGYEVNMLSVADGQCTAMLVIDEEVAVVIEPSASGEFTIDSMIANNEIIRGEDLGDLDGAGFEITVSVVPGEDDFQFSATDPAAFDKFVQNLTSEIEQQTDVCDDYDPVE